MFAGLLRFEDSPPVEAWVTPEVWISSLYPRCQPDVSGHQRDDHSLLVEADISNTPSSHHIKSVPLVAGRLRVAFWGRLDNREELAAQLVLGQPLDETPDADLVLAGWQQWSESLPEKLVGDFALAIIDSEKRTVFLARDPIGIKPLYYWPHAQGLIFASTPAALLKLKNQKPTPDPGWIARYIIGQSTSHDRTAYQEIMKLPGGHSLSVADGKLSLRRYHQWSDDAPDVFTRDPARVEAYRGVLEDVMRSQMISDYTLGTENSGGIDSATITSYLGKFLGVPGDRLHSFGFALLAEEPAYILETSQAASITHNHINTSHYGDPDHSGKQMLEDLEILGYPEEHGNATGHRPFYDQCRTYGIRTLFSGYGGDEVVTNYANHVQRELVDKGAYKAAIDLMKGKLPLRIWRLIRRINKERKNGGYNINFLKAWKERWPEQPLRDEVVARYNLEHEYMETARYDAVHRKHNDWIIGGLMQMAYVPTRLENCTLMAASYGIDYRWPLWDKRLVQQYLSTPIIERAGPGGIGRYLHRQAITGTVPDRVAWKNSKYMGERKTPVDNDMSDVADQMRRLDADLHPLLVDLIDRDKWRAKIKRFEAGGFDPLRDFQTRRHARSLKWLNVWLHGRPVA
jgi:asparagine synthase (glutamine-hydrolysing)